MFVDQASIKVKAGRGGRGLSSFRREKFVAKGGPDGGDGGNGGSVIVRSDHNVNTLAKFRHAKEIRAEDGENGKKRRAHGKSGDDTEIIVPPGTVIYNGGKQIADLKTAGQSFVLAKGGRGGFGNAHFKSSTRQAPVVAEIGEPGEELVLDMELKIVADIGLVGLPNAGKSTFLSVVSNARPRIADYPFTTLEPHLGVAAVFDTEVVIADIPGLISGASEGKGLGDDFLRHVERTRVLIHMVDMNTDDPLGDYRSVRRELEQYKVDLSGKPHLVALTKADVADKKHVAKVEKSFRRAGIETFTIAATAHKGVDQLLAGAIKLIEDLTPEMEEAQAEDVPTITLADDPEAWEISLENGRLVVRGEKVEGFALRTDTANEAAMARLKDILHKKGVLRELQRYGHKPGDPVVIAGKDIEI